MSASREIDHKLDCLSNSESQTQRLGMRLGAMLEPGSVVLLEGTMGSGKTVFTQGLAQGLEIEESVTSPSYTLIKEYVSGRLPLYHVDLYRIGSDDALLALGIEEYLDGDGVCVVEWARRVHRLLPPEWIQVRFEVVNDTKRMLHLEAEGASYQRLLQEYRKHAFGI